jgi:formate dehydrogenase iron-sulfur subunit
MTAAAHIKVCVPRDSAACAVGADAVADAITTQCAARGLAIDLVRTSSRGMFWLEPLVEVETADGRIGYGPLDAGDVSSLLDAGMLQGGAHALSLGRVEALDYLKRQQRLTFARAGITDPLSLTDYEAHGGWQGLRKAAAMAPALVWQQVLDSGLRGRGGAAFPAGIKWRTVALAEAAQKYVVCNADEGDSGTFADRMLLEGDPYLLIEGMAIAALACGATRGFVYIRSEYAAAVDVLDQAIALARVAGFLGTDVIGSGRAFELEVRVGAGSYVCGEETAMLESLEGRRGIVRAKPPVPALFGLFGKPTLINNVLTFAAAPGIVTGGAEAYKAIGIGRSTGTLPFQLAGNIRQGGLVELAFGVTLRELLYDFGGGSASGRPIKAVQVGGPLGTYLPESQWNVALDYEAYAAIGAVVGHGGLVVHDDSANLSQLARYAMEFCAIESCGKCTPCRIGSIRGVEVIDRIVGNADVGVAVPDPHARLQQVTLLRDLCDTMVHGSLCAMGGMTPYPVLSALNHFPADFGLQASERAAA